MLDYVADWLSLGLRWLHVIAGIAWIGTSFHFVALDNHLTPPRDPADRKRGVHGGGGGFTAAASTGRRSIFWGHGASR